MSAIYKTKTFWGGISAIVGGVSCYLTGTCSPVEAAQTVLAGILAIFLRHGIEKNN